MVCYRFSGCHRFQFFRFAAAKPDCLYQQCPTLISLGTSYVGTKVGESIDDKTDNNTNYKTMGGLIGGAVGGLGAVSYTHLDVYKRQGGVRAYNDTNLYSKKGAERFKVFIGFICKVCTNLCVSTDGFRCV